MAPWLIITGSGLDDWIYWHLLVQSLVMTMNYNNSHSIFSRTLLSWLPRLAPILVLVLVLRLTYESLTNLSWLTLHSWTLSSTTGLIQRSHVSSLYNFGKDRIEITTSNSSSIIVWLFVAAETFVNPAARSDPGLVSTSLHLFTFVSVDTFFKYPATVCVHESYLCDTVFANSFPRNAYMSQYDRWSTSICNEVGLYLAGTSRQRLL
jgi:hypothetical protein